MSAHQEPLLSLQDVTMTYRKGREWEPRRPAVSNVSISVQRGEILGLVGPSGCGKTTTLRVILGLETVDHGTIRVGGLDIMQVPAERRKIGVVFQNYALFTELNAFGNIAFGLQNKGIPAGEILRRVDTLLTMVQLQQEVKARRPHQLSAGEQQRVAIARALAIEPEILLLDEPFANLDAGLRRHTGEEIRALVKRLNIATILVTHDQSEAFGLCDRIGIMCMGRVVQTAAPRVVFERPSQPWVAKFFGFQLRTAQRLTGSGSMSVFRIEDGNWDLIVRNPSQIPDATTVTIALRPEDIRIVPSCAGNGRIPAKVLDVAFGGHTSRVRLAIGTGTLEAIVIRGTEPDEGDACCIEIAPESPLVYLPAAVWTSIAT